MKLRVWHVLAAAVAVSAAFYALVFWIVSEIARMSS